MAAPPQFCPWCGSPIAFEEHEHEPRIEALARVRGQDPAELPGYQTATPYTLQRRFLQTGGVILKTTTRSPSDWTAAPTHPCFAQPLSPTPPSPGGAAAASTSNTRKSRADLAARKSALTPRRRTAVCLRQLRRWVRPLPRGLAADLSCPAEPSAPRYRATALRG